jgi:non-specific serine/threonine protein kinase
LGVMLFLRSITKFPLKNKTKTVCWNSKKPSPFILRRTKEQVLKDLPELSEQVFYCDMEPEQEKLYEEEKSKARNALKPMVLALTK